MVAANETLDPRPGAAARSVDTRGWPIVRGITAVLCAVVLALIAASLLNLAFGDEATPAMFHDPISVAHLVLMITVITLTMVIMVLPKGFTRHRQLGWAWAGALVGAAVVSFGMHYINGGFSPPHVSSIITLVFVPLIVLLARFHRQVAHRRVVLTFSLLFTVSAGFQIFLPGRAFHSLLTGLWS